MAICIARPDHMGGTQQQVMNVSLRRASAGSDICLVRARWARDLECLVGASYLGSPDVRTRPKDAATFDLGPASYNWFIRTLKDGGRDARGVRAGRGLRLMSMGERRIRYAGMIRGVVKRRSTGWQLLRQLRHLPYPA